MPARSKKRQEEAHGQNDTMGHIYCIPRIRVYSILDSNPQDNASLNRTSMKSLIVKVQVSLYSSDCESMALIYNEDKSMLLEIPVDDDLVKLMDGEMKAFFYGKLDNNNGFTLTDKSAPWQDW